MATKYRVHVMTILTNLTNFLLVYRFAQFSVWQNRSKLSTPVLVS
jgi:hypothetical protein